MKVEQHGGGCCGITHIYEMYDEPAFKHASCTDKEPMQPSRPEENGVARLKAFVKYIRDIRPSGIIEVVLTGRQNRGWKKVLLAQGFKEVNRKRNSNSGNTCIVYHLNTPVKVNKKGKQNGASV